MNKQFIETLGNYTLFRLPDNACTKWVVAWKYNPKDDDWEQGHYFDDLFIAVDFMYHMAKEYHIMHNRLDEIASKALNWIEDETYFYDFQENYDLDFDEKELDYFGIER